MGLALRAGLGIMVLLTFWACNPLGSPGRGETADGGNNLKPDTVEVEVEKVVEGDFENEIWCHGVLLAAHKAIVSFEVGGAINQVLVRNGQKVHRGQVLATLDDYTRRHELEQAIINMHQARNNFFFEIVSAGHQVADTLRIPQSQLDIFSLRSGLDAARLAVSHARRQLELTHIKAPVDGVVSGLTAQAHTPSSAYPHLCTLLNMQELLAQFQVLESDVVYIRPGVKVEVWPLAFGGWHTTGEIIEIDPVVNSNGLVTVKARVKNVSENLLDGMKTRVVVKNLIPGQLLVPKAAVLARQNRQVVFTVEEGKADWNYVTVSYENSRHVAVSEGLEKGQWVIISNNFTIGHQAPIKVINKSH